MAELYNKETGREETTTEVKKRKRNRQPDTGRGGGVSISKAKLLQLKAVLYFNTATTSPFNLPV